MGKRRAPAPSPPAPLAPRRPGGSPPRVGILVPNLFLLAPVEAAVRGAGAVPVPLREVEGARREGCGVVVVDLEALGAAAVPLVEPLARAGVVVLAFGPHVEGEALAAVRRAGAVALPRSAFFSRLPELLQVALTTAVGAAGGAATPGAGP